MKLHTIFWYPTTILTGILAGYMVSNSIMLCRFFNWYITSGNEALLHQTYTVFRLEHSPQVPYNIPIYVALLVGILWTILSFIIKRDRIVAIIAGLSTLWVGIIFTGISLDEAESAVLSGVANDSVTRHYLNVNVPAHTIFAIIYIVSLFLLLMSGRRAKKQISKEKV